MGMVRLARFELQGLEDRLVMLVFMLKHHPEHEALIEKRILGGEIEDSQSL